MVDHVRGAYLDHAAASPIDPRVRDAMLPYLNEAFGSPESLHEWARRPAEAVDTARTRVARLIGADPAGIIFTAGETEARNLAVKGIASANRHRGAHIVASPVEHPATLASCRSCTRDVGELTLLRVDAEGRIQPDDLADTVRPDTVLLALSHGQAEIGTLQDVPGLVKRARASSGDPAVFVDATVTAGLVPISVDAWGCDAVALGGATLGAPRWIGCLWVREGTRLHPLIEGGLQEAGKRGGAHDVPSIVGFGVAAEHAAAELAARAAIMRRLTDRLMNLLLAIPGVRLNGPSTDRVPGHVQVSVGGVEAETLVLTLAARDVACSPGSACTAAGKASPVLEAIGLKPPWTHSAVLFTLSHTTTEDDVAFAAHAIEGAISDLRAMSPVELPS